MLILIKVKLRSPGASGSHHCCY